MFVLGGLWILTEILYGRKRDLEESIKNRVSKVLKHIDMPTILFFLGILMSVAGLQSAGILGSVANFLDSQVHEIFTIASAVGVLSSIIDNKSTSCELRVIPFLQSKLSNSLIILPLYPIV
jgi:Na+/H+ antiporter NhaD/arsenite permease-like protein